MANSDVQILITAQDRATDALRKLTSELATVTSKLNGVQAEATKSTTAVEGLANSFSMLSGTFGTFIKNAVYFTAMGAAIQGLTTAFTGGVSTMVGYNAQMQDLNIGFTTMIGNAEAAKYFIDQVKDMAAITPFSTEAITQAAGKMLAYGWKLKEVLPDLTTIGNAAAALNAGGTSTEKIDRMVLALGQLSMKARANAQDLKQLQEVGIDSLGYLGKKFNLTAKDLENLPKTGITGLEAMKAVLEGMANDKKFEGMMTAKSRALSGLWETLKDNTAEIFGKMGENLSKYLGGALTAITDKTTLFVRTMRNNGMAAALETTFGTDTGARIYAVGTIIENVAITIKNAFVALTGLAQGGGLFNWLIEGLYNAVAMLKVFSESLVENINYVSSYALVFAGATAIMYSPAIIAGFVSLIGMVTELRIAFTLLAEANFTLAAAQSIAALGGAAGAAGAAMAFLLSPVTIAAGVFLALGVALVYVESQFGAVSAVIGVVTSYIEENMRIIQAAVTGVIASWLAWVAITSSTTWLPIVGAAITSMIGWFRALSLAQMAQTATTAIAQLAALSWVGISAALTGAFSAVGTAAATMWAAISAPVTIVVAAIGVAVAAFVYFADTTGESGNRILKVMGDIVNSVKNAAKTMWNFLTGNYDGASKAKQGQIGIDFTKQIEEAKANMKTLSDEAKKALENAGGRTYDFKGGGDDAKAVGKTGYETQVDNILKLQASLEEKIAEVSKSAPDIAMAKLNKEITKFGVQIADAQREGIDTSAVESLVENYKKLYGDKITRDLLNTQRKFAAETKAILAKNSDDKIAIAQAEAEKRKVELDKQVEDWRKAGNTEIEIAQRRAATIIEIEKDLTEKVNAEKAARLNRDLQSISNQAAIQGIALPDTVAQTREVLLQQKALYEDLANSYVEGTEKRAEAERNLSDTIKKLNDQNRYNMSGSYREAIKDIKDKMIDYSKIMVQTFDDINSTVEGNFTKMLSGQQTFAEGMKNIWQQLTQDILSMMAKIIYYQMIYKPLQSFFTNMIGGLFGGGGGIPPLSAPGVPGSPGMAADGGYRQGWTLVGERGPELVNFSEPGRVYTADQTKRMLGGGGSQAPVTVNVINQTGQQMKVAQQETKFNGVETVVSLWLEGYAQNYNGMKTILGG